jgi:4-amino-4-deoxy-L-arabinose transferase-like glycosyltransferase
MPVWFRETFLQVLPGVLFGLLAYGPMFIGLEVPVLRLWDEARLAVNALEMMENRSYLVTYYAGLPDMWNTKPPLMIWLQVFSLKLLGVSELAIRLPAALAAFLTAASLTVFGARCLANPLLGFLAAGVLITSNGYIEMHVARTGDYEALLVLFTTVYSLGFFMYTESENEASKPRLLLVFFLTLTLAVLTKGIAGMLFLPALVVYAFIRKQIPAILTCKTFYLGLGLFLCFVVGYYSLRELLNPGYLHAVQHNELSGRYLAAYEGNAGNFLFYYNAFVRYRFTYWYGFVPAGLLIGLTCPQERMRRFSLFTTLAILLYFLVISLSRTKLEWYDAPCYPFCSLAVAIGIYWGFQTIYNAERLPTILRIKIFPWILVILIYLWPYSYIISKVTSPPASEPAWLYQLSYYLRHVRQTGKNLRGYCIVSQELDRNYDAHVLFYTMLLQRHGQVVAFKNLQELVTNDVVLTADETIKQYLEKHYMTQVVEQYEQTTVYRLLYEQ